MAGGPLSTRAMAEALADYLNNRLDPARWDWFFDHQLRNVLAGEWG